MKLFRIVVAFLLPIILVVTEGYAASVAQHREKRQTVVSGDVNVNDQRGGRRVTGNLNLDHALNSKHSIGGSFGVDHTKIRGVGSGTDFNAGLKYTFTPNDRTALSIGAVKNWGSSGSGINYGLKLSHSFRRRRSPERLKYKCRSNGACKLKIRGRRT
ncbi:uncharacterized protein LOC135103265 [Scylla paramamosain]|uniref:uncharacterized protein LOC135103265 n=1 Tax=Scylla paramamosain TaxID=85552 RepID=UPI0030827914